MTIIRTVRKSLGTDPKTAKSRSTCQSEQEGVGAVTRARGQVTTVEVAHKLFNLETELLVKEDGGVRGRDVQGEVLAQVSLNEVVEDERSQTMSSPSRVNCKVGEVGLAPPGRRGRRGQRCRR